MTLTSSVKTVFSAACVAVVVGLAWHLAFTQNAFAEEIAIAGASYLNFAIKDLFASY